MSQLILIRHGQSLWNQANLFTGWVNIPLSQQGYEEAQRAGQQLAQEPIDKIYTSTLLRAQQTATLIMQAHHSQRIPTLLSNDPAGEHSHWDQLHSKPTEQLCIAMHTCWQLNERYYGDLQGMNKDEARETFGADQVHIWRRSFDIPPPNGESLEMTAARTIPFFKDSILPDLRDGKNILISAHGNSLRSIVMELEQLSKEAVLSLEIATGDPIKYQFESEQFTRVSV
ncbi:MAG: phosphoglycerate mutase [Legionellales bacterium]|nr:phosphoglycerate mutase [Legionellales bacterium]HAG62036.1 phosphoglycerate mutase [Coxiellaceae bacterium]|tara:strand:+ start:209 stop:892 length:684 start_codon:yes stop_codon:yes gene_type:complete